VVTCVAPNEIWSAEPQPRLIPPSTPTQSLVPAIRTPASTSVITMLLTGTARIRPNAASMSPSSTVTTVVAAVIGSQA